MGLIVDIYKHKNEDFSNGGVSALYDRLLLTNVSGPWDGPIEDAAPARIVKGNLPGTVKIVPECLEETQQYMMGGCYAATSDSRFNQAIEEILGHRFYGAVPIHDRVE